MSYWWVSQNQTYNEESNGGYLWAPKLSKSGDVIFHWENIKLIQPGDLIFSYYRQKIMSIAIARTESIDRVKPPEFTRDYSWNGAGRIVYADYQLLAKPIQIKDLPISLKSKLIGKKLPFTINGTGNQGYLYNIPIDAAHLLIRYIESFENISVDEIVQNTLNQQADNGTLNIGQQEHLNFQSNKKMLLESLRPTKHNRVIDLVEAAGIDVSEWANYKGQNPATNPKYCYEWAFAKPGQPIVLNLWYDNIKVGKNEDFFIIENLRNKTIELERLQGNNSPKALRARRMDDALKLASRVKNPVRVIICEGPIKDRYGLDERSSVEFRHLDEVLWWVDYDMQSGNCIISRGMNIQINVNMELTLLEAKEYSQNEMPITDREIITNSRIGQDKFRNNLIDLWKGRCCITGCSLIKMLRASHIKPWKDSNNYERLDKFNGLLILPQYDQAFDRGLITFDTNGKIILSKELEQLNINLFGISRDASINEINDAHRNYLEHHQKWIFKK